MWIVLLLHVTACDVGVRRAKHGGSGRQSLRTEFRRSLANLGTLSLCRQPLALREVWSFTPVPPDADGAAAANVLHMYPARRDTPYEVAAGTAPCGSKNRTLKSIPV